VSNNRLFVKVTRKNLPFLRDRHPFVYLERGRLEIDDSSVKWVDNQKNIVRLPIAMLCVLMLGPGISITHEAVKIIAAANCLLSWVGEDSLFYYATGLSPNHDTVNMLRQINRARDDKTAVAVARRMFSYRFPGVDLQDKTLPQLRGMEGYRVKQRYAQLAKQYGVSWHGRSFTPGQFSQSDVTNKILTVANSILYGLLLAFVHAMGYTPYVGFIHSGCPLPFVYDIADLYKDHLCVDLAFSLTQEMADGYKRRVVFSHFRERIVAGDILRKIPRDIETILYGESNGNRTGE